ncbi:uncharacterized protein LOC130747106 isoform X1 [Lotus japonicus]|uniref:uncharacterized protein LOC130747106 isoform X1 n=1 Tax=Lotus japonicus TaxID=34305 RepID=UPI0025850D95|nr:uncharacterized protein LOC130747106 isoform X1 [Lotus japonicus]
MLRVAPRFLTKSPLRTISPFAPPRFSSARYIDAPFQKIQIPRKTSTFDGYLVGEHDAHGIVLLQDWLGVDYHVKNHALRISQLGPGFKVLIPDMCGGNYAQQLFYGIDWDEALMKLDSSTTWLQTNGSKKVGVTGFGMGGALAIAGSIRFPPSFDAIVAFHGSPPRQDDPGYASAPVQAHFGELDDFVGFSDVKTAKELEENFKESEYPYEVHIYPGKGHAFMDSMILPDEDDAEVQLAWSRFKEWMTRYLYS